LIAVAVLALSALTSHLALAAPDELIPCKKLSVKPDNFNVKFRCKAPKGVSFALPEGTSAPTGPLYVAREIRKASSGPADRWS
jgi:hypothetical protein